MLGCIHPMSSPMMKRMLGFCPCAWAGAGRFAIVVAIHDATRALQIVLNKPMIAFLFSATEATGRGLRPAPPADRFCLCRSEQEHVSGSRSNASRRGDWLKQTGCDMQLRQVPVFCADGTVGAP